MRFTWLIPVIHSAVWLLLLAVPYLVFQGQPIVTGLPHGFFLITNVVHIGLFYLNVLYLYPRLLTAKWWWLYCLVLIVIIAGLYTVKRWLVQLALPSFVLTNFTNRILFFPPLAFLIASIIYRIIYDRLQQEKRQKEIQTGRLDSELKLLRSQINPHFLFNMMTNMVALARQKSALLEPSLIKLSELLRYMLYGPGKEQLRITDEINYLTSYIELQQLRFGDTVRVTLNVQTDDVTDCFIEPMLLVPFVENAFKHGIGALPDCFIHIQLQVHNQQLFFCITNRYNNDPVSKDNSSGIGIVNVKNRLQLLYPNRHSIIIDDIGKQYTVTLKITLAC